MNNEFKDYYKILGVTPRASFENIRSAAERELSQNWNNAIGRLEIQEAYEILSDPDRRKEYDTEFNKRLNEREVAIRNARTFEEYMAATSLHSELANVEQAPEVTVPQEEMSAPEINNQTEETKENISETIEEKDQPTVESIVGSDLSESSSDDVQSSETTEEEIQENEEEQIDEEEQEEREQAEEQEQKEQTEEQEEKVQEKLQEKQLEDQRLELAPKSAELPNTDEKETKNEMEQNPEVKKVIDKKQLWKNIAIIGGAALVGRIPGIIIATVILSKKGKLKLQKVPKAAKITKVQTEETKIIEEYNKNLEAKVREILSKPLSNNQDNYELQIAQLKYQNQMEMIEKQIEFRLNQTPKKGHKAFDKLRILSLQHQHKQIAEKLQLIDSNKSKLSANSPKNDKLGNIYENISIRQEALNKINSKAEQDLETQDKIDASNLRMQINLLNKQRQELIDQKVGKIDSIARNQFKQAEEIERSKSM